MLQSITEQTEVFLFCLCAMALALKVYCFFLRKYHVVDFIRTFVVGYWFLFFGALAFDLIITPSCQSIYGGRIGVTLTIFLITYETFKA